MPNPTCTVADCERPCRTSRAIYCGMHYLRWYTHGDANYERPQHGVCTVDGCTRRPRSKVSGLCEAHYYRIRRNGDLALRDRRRDDVNYRSAHGRIQHDKGRASEYSCVDCGIQAQHWSYDHSDADEMISPGGQPYSLRTECYEPRCASCHALFDGTGANQYSSR